MNDPYADIRSLPYPRPTRRKRMSRLERAAQFTPFAALSGFDEANRETEQQTTEALLHALIQSETVDENG